MSELHMVRALTWNSNFDLEERLTDVRDRLAEIGWESLDPEWILKVCKAALRLDIAVENPDRASSGIEEQPSVIDDATTSLFRAAGWLRQHCGVRSPRIVPYRMQIVMLAEALRLCPDPTAAITRRLIQWFWNTTYTGRFAGITGGQTNAMLDGLRRVAAGLPLETKIKKERAPIFTEPAVFKPSFVRVKAIALRLAALNPLDLNGESMDADSQLASEGPGALVPLDPSFRGSAGRMFTRRDSHLRTELLLYPENVDVRVLRSHAITSEAFDALYGGELNEFHSLRGKEIRRLEEEFYASTQRES